MLDSVARGALLDARECTNAKNAPTLGGRIHWEDPKTKVFEPEGAITGTRQDGVASWKTEGDVVVEGKFEGNTFVGTITFPADEGGPSRTVGVTLTR